MGISITPKSIQDAALLLCNVFITYPIGGILALLLTHVHFSVSSAVGFLALFDTSVQTGLILISYFQQLRARVATI